MNNSTRMKKFIVTLLTLALIGCGYYVYKNKHTFIYNYDGTEVNDYSDKAKPEQELNSLKLQLVNLKKTNDSLLSLLPKSSKEVKSLRTQIASLRYENEELKKELELRKVTSKATASTIKPQKKNEKILPIARNSHAIELQRYLTELYGNR